MESVRYFFKNQTKNELSKTIVWLVHFFYLYLQIKNEYIKSLVEFENEFDLV